jgi:hypothetical protein
MPIIWMYTHIHLKTLEAAKALNPYKSPPDVHSQAADGDRPSMVGSSACKCPAGLFILLAGSM